MPGSDQVELSEGVAAAEPTVDVAVLGPVGLTVDTAFLAPASQTMRMLLGVLALAPGHELSADTLFNRLWGDRFDAPTRTAMQVAIHRLRKWLTDTVNDAVRIDRTATGYRLRLARGDTDANRFRTLTVEATHRDPPARIEVLERALLLWRGQPLADLPDQVVDLAAVARLEEHRRSAWLDLGRALLATNHPARAIDVLTPATGEHPLDEELHAVLIEARAALGDRTGALDTYERLRARLADQLGVDPSGQLQRVYLTVLHQELRDQDTPNVAAQLPAEPALFTGRDVALRQLDKMLREAKAATVPMIAVVAGMAGVGKTALALRWAHLVKDEFPDGQLYLNLRGYSPGTKPLPAREALGQLLRSLGTPSSEIPVDEDEAAAEFRSRTAGRRLLILLDNAWTTDQVRPLLAGSPSCCTVITSRDQLNGLVARDGARRVGLGVLDRKGAEHLLAMMLGDQARREPAATAELAGLCGYLPLALRIAAANLDSQPTTSIAGHVARVRSGDLLGALQITGDLDATVRVAFDLSYRALPDQARNLFQAFGLVPGADITTPAIAAIVDRPVAEVRRTLDMLVAAHLVDRQDVDRFGCHDLLRHYARDRAAQDWPGSTEPAMRRLVEWYLHSVDAAVRLADPQWVRLPVPARSPAGQRPPAATFAGRAEAITWLDAERANIVATVEYATGHGHRDTGWLLANAVAGYLNLRAQTLDGYAVATAALDALAPPGSAGAPPGTEVRAHAAVRLDLARACQRLSHYEDAIRLGTEAAELSAQAEWYAGQSSALAVLGVVLGELGRIDTAIETATRAWRISRDHELSSLEGELLNDLGIGHLWLGRLDNAEEHFTQARRLHRDTGSLAGENISTISLAQLSLEAGRLDAAIGYLAAASELVRREGEILGWPRIFNTLAAVHGEAGRYQEAVSACLTALPVAERIADRVVRSSLLNNLGDAYLSLGRFTDCADAHRQALDLAKQAGLVRHQGGALLGLARYYRATGEPDKGKANATKALRLERASSRVWREGQALTELAACEAAIGELAEAAEHAREAVALHRRAGHRLAEARALEVSRQIPAT